MGVQGMCKAFGRRYKRQVRWGLSLLHFAHLQALVLLLQDHMWAHLCVCMYCTLVLLNMVQHHSNMPVYRFEWTDILTANISRNYIIICVTDNHVA